MRKGLIIFIRNPIIGKVKTRLAKTTGDEKALQIYTRLLEHTHNITKDIDCDKFVFYADFINSNDLWENDIFNKRMQADGDLGEKMSGAFNELFNERYNQLMIIGSDCIELDATIIESAFDILTKKDAVVGPSKDGGYYLLGMSSFFPDLFINKQWSSSTVLIDTLRNFSAGNISFESLQELIDIDEEKDLPPYLAHDLLGRD